MSTVLNGTQMVNKSLGLLAESRAIVCKARQVSRLICVADAII
jgi:hypothetical protein